MFSNGESAAASITSLVPVLSHLQMSSTVSQAMDGAEGVFLESRSDH